jgi:hypothetical protein
MAEEKTGEFYLRIEVKDPKENAPEYEISTIEELFDVLTEENFDRFLKDFEAGMRSGIAMREMVKEIAKANDIEPDDSLLKMPTFTWIDDRKD